MIIIVTDYYYRHQFNDPLPTNQFHSYHFHLNSYVLIHGQGSGYLSFKIQIQTGVYLLMNIFRV